MRIYLDCCCYNRPYDDLRQDRIQIEAEAVLEILSRAAIDEIELTAGEAVEIELARCPDAFKRRAASSLLSIANQRVHISEKVRQKASGLQSRGFGPYDALHLASALAGEVDVFLTVDDDLLRKARRILESEPMRIQNPVDFLIGKQRCAE